MYLACSSSYGFKIPCSNAVYGYAFIPLWPIFCIDNYRISLFQPIFCKPEYRNALCTAIQPTELDYVRRPLPPTCYRLTLIAPNTGACTFSCAASTLILKMKHLCDHDGIGKESSFGCLEIQCEGLNCLRTCIPPTPRNKENTKTSSIGCVPHNVGQLGF